MSNQDLNALILQEKRPSKSKFVQNFKEPLFVIGKSHGYHFWPVLRHLSVLSKKCSFSALVNITWKYDNLNVKSSLNWMPFENCTGRFHKLCSSPLGLSEMVLFNVITFAVLKILHNLVSMQNHCLQITAEVSKIRKYAQCDLTFIFSEL